MIEAYDIAKSVSDIYTNGAWKIFTLITVIGIVLIFISSKKLLSRRESNKMFDGGAGLIAVRLSLAYWLLIYRFSNTSNCIRFVAV